MRGQFVKLAPSFAVGTSPRSIMIGYLLAYESIYGSVAPSYYNPRRPAVPRNHPPFRDGSFYALPLFFHHQATHKAGLISGYTAGAIIGVATQGLYTA